MKIISNGCLIIVVLILQSCTSNEEIPVLDASYEVTPITCNGNGNVDLTVFGGLPPYNYLWSDQTVSEDLEEVVEEGVFSVVITDSEGRAKIVSEIEVPRPPSVLLVEETISPSELSKNNGSISLSITGGVSPYTILWSNGETSEVISELSRGVYTVEISDVNLCTVNVEYEVEEIGLLVDDRDGNIYEIRQHGSQVWMYNGLRFVTGIGSSYKYDDEQYADWAGHYLWPRIMNDEASSASTPSGVRGICPEGWHVPSPNEWSILQSFLESEKDTKGDSFDFSDYFEWPCGVYWARGDPGFGFYWQGGGTTTWYATSDENSIFHIEQGVSLSFSYSFVTVGTGEFPINSGEYKNLCHCIKN